MSRRNQEKLIQFGLIVATFVMIILRFLMNEKGRVNPDSIRFMRTAHVFPVIDNTTTPLGYPLSLKLFSLMGFGEFWGSKILGVLAFLFMVWFAWKKRFYFRETVLVGGLFSFVSIFAYTMSEPLMLPFVFLFLYIGRKIIIDELSGSKAIFYLSLILILLYNIRYPSLFIIGGTLVWGILNFRKHYGSTFIFSGLIGLVFVALYKFFFIDYFNANYVDEFLEIGIHPTSKLLTELFQGLTTSFNPFIHIANPAGGFINFAIYGIGLLNIDLMISLFLKSRLSETQRFFLIIGVAGIVSSFFIQYFYSITPLDYRLLIAFTFPIWLLYFRKFYQFFGRIVYGITILSLISGFAFTWLSRGNYLENRREITTFLKSENLENLPLKFYVENPDDLDKVQIAELISTVNPNISWTNHPKDTLKRNVLTAHKVLSKMKIDTNKFQ